MQIIFNRKDIEKLLIEKVEASYPKKEITCKIDYSNDAILEIKDIELKSEKEPAGEEIGSDEKG